MQHYDFLTIGSATRDLFVQSSAFRLERAWHGRGGTKLVLPLGAKVDVAALVLSTGGGATNAAATFRNFGFSVAYLGAVGNDDNGRAIMEELAARSIATDCVVRPRRLATAFSVILTTGAHGRVILTHRPDKEFVPAYYEPMKKLKARWLYATSLAGKLALARSIFTTAKLRGMKIAWNPGMDELRLRERVVKLLALVNVLLLNREEAAMLLRRSGAGMGELAQRLGKHMAGIAVVSDGQHGLCVSQHHALAHATSHPHIRVVEPTGAGDALGSGFLVGLVRSNGNVTEAIHYGVANAESVIQKIGAKNGLLRQPPPVRERVTVTIRHCA